MSDHSAPFEAHRPGLWRPHGAFAARSLGLVGWAGLAAILAGVAGLAAVAPALERANERGAQQIAMMQQRWSVLRDPKRARAQSDPVGNLVASLPPATDFPAFVADLQRRADAGAVEIDRTEYRVQPVLGSSARRYRLSFPAHVDYPHLRAWLEALLHDYPSLVLDEVTMHRAVDGGEELEAHVALSFLAREGT